MKIIYDTKETKEAIVRAIAFFDMFNYPLSVFEVFKFIELKSDINQIDRILIQMVSDGVLESKNSFYYLPKRSEIVGQRIDKFNHSERKFRIAIKITKYFRFVPWVRLVAIVNLMGADNLRDEGDIDLFIVSEKNRLWLTRFFTALITKILNMRPKERNSKDKICLSFFVGIDSLNLGEMQISQNDLYFKYWLANIVPIYCINDTYSRLIKKNSEMLNQFPNWRPVNTSSRRFIVVNKTYFYENFIDLFFSGLEKTFMHMQLYFLPNSLKTEMHDKKVIVSESIIKLHKNDRRKEFINAHKEKIKLLNEKHNY